MEADVARGHVVVVRANVRDQGVQNGCVLAFGNQADGERHGLRGLAALVVAVARGVEESGVECLAYRFCLLAIVQAVIGLAQESGCLFHHAQVLVFDGRGGKAERGEF